MNYLISNYTKGSNDKKTAASKAVEDISFFLGNNENYSEISYINPYGKVTKRIKRLLYSYIFFSRNLKGIDERDTIILQYPLHSSILEYNFLEVLKKKKAKKIVIIHDLESLRVKKDDKKYKKWEIRFLNAFDIVIAHNEAMIKYLKNIGIISEIRNLQLFDYNETSFAKNIDMNLPICYAGNLEKSKFIEKINGNQKYNIYGVFPSDNYGNSINYKGAFSPDELVSNIEGSFGLVWDGNSVDKCDGLTGDYLRYNNPHKTSLYLSMGMPVIVWSEAAISEFVEKHKVGITVSSLREAENIIKNMDVNQYNCLKKNSGIVAKKIRNGFFINSVIN